MTDQQTSRTNITEALRQALAAHRLNVLDIGVVDHCTSGCAESIARALAAEPSEPTGFDLRSNDVRPPRSDAVTAPDEPSLALRHEVYWVDAGRDEPPENGYWKCTCGSTFAPDGVDEYVKHLASEPSRDADYDYVCECGHVRSLHSSKGACNWAGCRCTWLEIGGAVSDAVTAPDETSMIERLCRHIESVEESYLGGPTVRGAELVREARAASASVPPLDAPGDKQLEEFARSLRGSCEIASSHYVYPRHAAGVLKAARDHGITLVRAAETPEQGRGDE